MKNVLFLFIVFFIHLSTTAYNQNINVSGFVSDKNTGEKIINTIVSNYHGNETVTNEFGYFNIKIYSGDSLSFSHISYKPKIIRINSKKDTVLNVFQLPNENEIDEVVIHCQKNTILLTQSNIIDVNIENIKKLPALGGETDIIRSLKLFPGIQSGDEGTTGLYVRGGGSDQNLFLLDGVPLYNISHLFGFMSIFNVNAIKSIKTIKGGFPAQYGGRISSVTDIRLKEGNMKKISGNYSVGLISSEFLLESPIKKDKLSFLISARRTYIDGLLHLVYLFLNHKNDIDETNYHFYDLTGKINYKFSEKNRIYLSFYSGKDNFANKLYYNNKITSEKDISKLIWGSKLINLRYNYVFSKNKFLNTNVYYSYYSLINNSYQQYTDKENTLNNSFYEINYSSEIGDLGLITNLDIYHSNNYHIKTGVNIIRHIFLPGIKSVKSEYAGKNISKQNSDGIKIPANELRVYFENNIKFFPELKFNIGINASLFNVQNTNYYSIEPRISGVYILSDKSSVKTSYAVMKQYLHLLTNAGFGLPTNLWVPPTSTIKPQKAGQYTLGFYQKLPLNIIISIETYYKKMKNMITYQDNTSFFIENKDWDTKIWKDGKGKSFGLEFLFQKTSENTQILLAYTLSKTTRQFNEINNGKEYSYKYDRRHDIAISYIYTVNKKITISANWIFSSGNAVTIPVAVYPSVLYPPSINEISSEDENYNPIPISQTTYRTKTEIFDYGERNSQRMPAYHRLDLNISFIKNKKKGKRFLSFSLYNAYSRRNPYYLIYAFDDNTFGNYNAKGEFKIISLFPILPSISYSFKFN